MHMDYKTPFQTSKNMAPQGHSIQTLTQQYLPLKSQMKKWFTHQCEHGDKCYMDAQVRSRIVNWLNREWSNKGKLKNDGIKVKGRLHKQ